MKLKDILLHIIGIFVFIYLIGFAFEFINPFISFLFALSVLYLYLKYYLKIK